METIGPRVAGASGWPHDSVGRVVRPLVFVEFVEVGRAVVQVPSQLNFGISCHGTTIDRGTFRSVERCAEDDWE